MGKKIITTVGTSLLDKAKRYHNNQLSNYDEVKSLSFYENWNQNLGEYGAITDLKNQIRTYIQSGNDGIDASAEIKSLVKIQEQENCKLEVYLICTDTILSVVAAEMIVEWFRGYDEKKENFEIKFEHTEECIIKGLQVDDADKFEQEGFNNLLDKLQEHFKDNTILNISGGYKAIIPVLTIIGQLYDLPLNYIYEDSERIIPIEPLPISFDWAKIELYRYFLKEERRKQLDNFSEIKAELVKQKLIRSDNKFTVIGNLFWQYIDKTVLSQNVFGFFFECKIYEAFITSPQKGYNQTPLLNEKYYLDKENQQIAIREIPENERGQNKYVPVEFDLILKNDAQKCAIVECKSYSEIEKTEDFIEKSKRKIYTKQQVDTNETLEDFIIVIHKFDFQRMEDLNNSLNKIKQEISINLTIYTVDIPYSWDKSKVNYTNFMKKKLEFGIDIKPYVLT